MSLFFPIQPFETHAPVMHFHTSIGFILVGVAILARHYGRNRITIVTSFIVLILATMNLVRHFTGSEVVLEHLFSHTLTDFPEQDGIAPNTAIAFLALNLPLLLASRGARLRSRQNHFFLAGGTIAATIGLLGIVAALPGMRELFGHGSAFGMATTTAFMMLLLGSAFVIHTGQDQARAWIQWMPLVSGIVLLAITVQMTIAVKQHEQRSIDSTVTTAGELAALEIGFNYDQRLRAIQRLALRGSALSAEETDRITGIDAEQYLGHFPAMRAIGWLDVHGNLVFRTQGERTATDHPELTQGVEPALEKVGKFGTYVNGVYISSDLITLGNRQLLLFAAQSTRLDQTRFRVSFLFDLVSFLNGIIPATVQQNHHLRVSTHDGHWITIHNNGKAFDGTHLINIPVEHLTGRWQLQLSPTEAWVTNYRTALPMIILGFGVVVSVAIIIALLAARRASIARLFSDTILNAAGEGIYGVDANGNTTFLNPAAERMLGWPAEEMLGKRQHNLSHHTRPDGTSYPADECHIYRAYREGKSNRVDTELFWRKDGTSFPVDYTSTPTFDIDGNITGAVVVFQDISEKNNLIENLRNTNNELESFTYTVSHDLRAPLRTMDGFSHAVLEDYSGKLDDQGREYLNRIRNASRKMAELIDALLAFSRLTRGELKIRRTSLSDLAREVAESLQASYPDRDVDISIQPKMYDDVDPTLFQVVMENLVGNAWKFTGEKEKAVIKIGKRVEGPLTVYYVEDNGAGFDMDYVDKLFKPFQRLHAYDEFEGTGIGLASVARIIHRHGGRVWATSAAGRGTTINFTICEILHDPGENHGQ
ncbi:MAG: PAS domain-containing protein [Gammaproteobacteria bacterium]